MQDLELTADERDWISGLGRYASGAAPQRRRRAVTAVHASSGAGQVGASTQNQAFSASLFLYREVLDHPLELPEVPRAKAPVRLPLVLSAQEVSEVLRPPRHTVVDGFTPVRWRSAASRMRPAPHQGRRSGPPRDHGARRQGPQGPSDRAARPTGEPLRAHLDRVQRQHQQDLAAGARFVALPYALARKYPLAQRESCWQWVFPATRLYVDPETGTRRRHHLHESVLAAGLQDGGPRSRVGQVGQLPRASGLDRPFDGIRVEYTSSYSGCTHCPEPSRGPRFGFGFLWRKAAGQGSAPALWVDTNGGTPDDVVAAFAEDVAVLVRDPEKARRSDAPAAEQ
jgi:hypothetical protein